ncbi:MAG: hypothetical protein HY300_04020, partial [Verrucomicrobia bacterium]|nr:hypothetical protein [Verrucomicrobiota bacterium]
MFFRERRLTCRAHFSITIPQRIQETTMPPKTADKSVEKSADTKAAEASKIAATRARELDAAISTITKSYGECAIMRLGDAQAQRKMEVI